MYIVESRHTTPKRRGGLPLAGKCRGYGWQLAGSWNAFGWDRKIEMTVSVSTAKILQLSRLSTWFMIPCLEVRLLNTSLQEKIWTYFQTPNMNTHGWLNDGSHLWQCLNDFSMCRTIRTSLLLLCLMPLVVPGLFLVKYFFLRWNNLTLFVRLSLKVWQMLDVKIPSTSGVS